MTFFFGKSAPGRETIVPIIPLATPITIAASDEACRSSSVANWENEGGHLAGRHSIVPLPALSSCEVERLQVQVNLASIKLVNDFANGRVGLRYNTYAHRARVLRLQKAELGAMRTRLNEPERGH